MINKIEYRKIKLGSFALCYALIFAFSACRAAADYWPPDSFLLMRITNQTNAVMSGLANTDYNDTVHWRTDNGAVDNQIAKMCISKSPSNLEVEIYETAANYAFKVSGTLERVNQGIKTHFYYVNSITVSLSTDGTKNKTFNIPGPVYDPWTRNLNLSEIGANKGFPATDLSVKWDRGDSSHLGLTLIKPDAIPDLKGLWYTDTFPQSPLFIDVIEEDNGMCKLGLVPGTTRDWGRYTSLTYYDVPVGYMIKGSIIRYNMKELPFMNDGNSITYEMVQLGNGPLTLVQKTCGGFPTAAKGDPKQAASISWWKKAKTLTQAAYVKIPDDVASITGVYVDQASGKNVYVGLAKLSDCPDYALTFIPDVDLPLPVPPDYPGQGNSNIAAIRCDGKSSGYSITGNPSRWLWNSYNYSFQKFNYHIIKDSNGNTMLIQDNCDVTGMPDPKSVTWWKNAKVLIKKTDKNKLMDKQNNGEINLSQDVNAKFTGKNGKI